MSTLEEVLVRLKLHITKYDPSIRNVPVGISISSSGVYFVVKYSLSQGPVFEDLDKVIEHIQSFLDNAESKLNN